MRSPHRDYLVGAWDSGCLFRQFNVLAHVMRAKNQLPNYCLLLGDSRQREGWGFSPARTRIFCALEKVLSPSCLHRCWNTVATFLLARKKIAQASGDLHREYCVVG